jgi:hypothetical protein
MMRARVAMAVCLSVGLTLAAAGLPAQEKREPADEVQVLLEKLHSQRYREREEATRKLLAMEQAALPALQKALASATSLDFRRRVEHILGVFRERQRQRDRGVAIAKGKHVAADVLVERLVARGKAASADDWQAVGDLARALTLWAGDKTGQAERWFIPLEKDFLQCPLWILDKWEWKQDDAVQSLRKRLVVGSDSIVEIADGSLIICRGHLRVHHSASQAVVLINGDLKIESIGGSISQSVIFCDGDVGSKRINRSVIVATGRVTFDESSSKENVISENARNPLPFLKLFTPADVGIAVAVTGGQVRVKEVRSDSAFAKAGARAGDRILAVKGTAVLSAEQFRRLLRASVAANAETTFQLRRGGKDLQVRVVLRE